MKSRSKLLEMLSKAEGAVSPRPERMGLIMALEWAAGVGVSTSLGLEGLDEVSAADPIHPAKACKHCGVQVELVPAWYNDCGTLVGEYSRKCDAETAARAWKRSMVDIECTAADRRDARAAYQWEVVEVEPDAQLDPESAPDNPRPEWA